MKVLLAVLALSAGGWIWERQWGDEVEQAASLGEQVYISEGCIHCHSQYSRPVGDDEELYGPATDFSARGEGAVLIGNRRQGPDLSSIGLRRSREWNKAHLIDPQSVSPASRMPSYRHLFEGEGERGEALLDYLSTLGANNAVNWYATRSEWKSSAETGDRDEGRHLFARLCSHCHGEGGDGEGALAGQFALPPTRLAGTQYRFVPLSLESEMRRERLRHVVKYGILGTPMPGHEYLTDQQIEDLVSFVIELPAGD